mgnify:CR=1 FL=1
MKLGSDVGAEALNGSGKVNASFKVNENGFNVYRGMTENNGVPQVGNTARTLGVMKGYQRI